MSSKVLLLNGSPKPGKSTSQSLGEYLVERLQQHGMSCDTLKVRRCHESEEGVQQLVTAVQECDLLVISAPLYVDTPPALMIKAMEILAAARKASPPTKQQRLFVICNAGFPEPEQNQIALAIYRHFARQAGFIWTGSVAIGAGGMINAEPLSKLGGMVKNVTTALNQAAVQLSTLPGESAELITYKVKPSLPNRLYLSIGSMGWRLQARKYGTKKKLDAKPYQK